MSLLRIQEVQPLGGFSVQLKLTDGTKIVRDLQPLLAGPIFESIRSNDTAFRAVRVEDGSLSWPNGADLCPDVLIYAGAPPGSRALAS